MKQQTEVMLLMSKRIETMEFMRHAFTVRPRDRRRMQQLIKLLQDKLC